MEGPELVFSSSGIAESQRRESTNGDKVHVHAPLCPWLLISDARDRKEVQGTIFSLVVGAGVTARFLSAVATTAHSQAALWPRYR